MRRRRSPEIIAGRVNADGSIATATGDFTIVKGTAGLFTVNFPAGFRLVGFSALAGSGGGSFTAIWRTDLTTGAALVVQTTITTTAAVSDAPWSFTAVGVQQ